MYSSTGLIEWADLTHSWLQNCFGRAVNVSISFLNDSSLYQAYIDSIGDASPIIFLFDCHRLTESLSWPNNISILLMQTECIQSQWFTNTKYHEMLHKADRILEYSLENAGRLKGRFPSIAHKIAFVPFPVQCTTMTKCNDDQSINSVQQRQSTTTDNQSNLIPMQIVDPFKDKSSWASFQERTIDILFVGCLNKRREQILQMIEKHAANHKYTYKTIFGGHSPMHVSKLFMCTKLVINLHYHNYKVSPCAMESSRIIPALSCGCAVISEPMGAMDEQFLETYMNKDQLQFSKFMFPNITETIDRILCPTDKSWFAYGTNASIGTKDPSYISNYCTNLFNLFNIHLPAQESDKLLQD